MTTLPADSDAQSKAAIKAKEYSKTKQLDCTCNPHGRAQNSTALVALRPRKGTATATSNYPGLHRGDVTKSLTP